MADSDKFVDEETADGDKSISMKRNQWRWRCRA